MPIVTSVPRPGTDFALTKDEGFSPGGQRGVTVPPGWLLAACRFPVDDRPPAPGPCVRIRGRAGNDRCARGRTAVHIAWHKMGPAALFSSRQSAGVIWKFGVQTPIYASAKVIENPSGAGRKLVFGPPISITPASGPVGPVRTIRTLESGAVALKRPKGSAARLHDDGGPKTARPRGSSPFFRNSSCGFSDVAGGRLRSGDGGRSSRHISRDSVPVIVTTDAFQHEDLHFGGAKSRLAQSLGAAMIMADAALSTPQRWRVGRGGEVSRASFARRPNANRPMPI